MDQKRFKQFRDSVSIKVFEAGKYWVEVRQNRNSYDIFVDDHKVESFRTKQRALETAEQAAKALGNKE